MPAQPRKTLITLFVGGGAEVPEKEGRHPKFKKKPHFRRPGKKKVEVNCSGGGGKK